MSRRIVYIMFLLLPVLGALRAQTPQITVEGSVTDRDGAPVPGVVIQVEKNKSRGTTGENGTFRMRVEPDAQLSFSSMGFDPVKVRLRGRTHLEIVLKTSDTLLPEVVVTSARKKGDKIMFAPSEMELVRNKLYLRTRYQIPKERFHKDSRLILHPYLINHTRNTCAALTPVVYDGKNYDILLRRGNICGAPEDKERYSPFAEVVDGLSEHELITHTDSCTVDNVDDEYSTEVRVKISTFCEDEYRDTVTITHGVKYPMRFFDYHVVALDLDDRYAPRQTPISFHEKGLIHLRFRAGDAGIYENEGNNGKELRKLIRSLEDVDKDSTKTLRVFGITTYNSPEGTYEYNLKLAQRRTRNAVEKILSTLSSETVRKARVSHEGVIESWMTVYDRMVKDGRPEAEELGGLIRRTREKHNEISWGARRLRCYSLINDLYLTPLRRVEYVYEYSELRTLHPSEMEVLFQKSPENLTASELWSYIRQQPDLSGEKREALFRQALEIYPDLTIAANNLAATLIRQERADTTLLKPFLTEDAPGEIWINQMAALLQVRDFDQADRFSSLLPDNENTRTVKALAAAMNGRYEEAYAVLGPLGGINQVVLLLSMKRDREAWEVLKRFENPSADILYLRAIAAQRLNQVGEAFTCLKTAIEMKPELEGIARKDGDVLDLLENEKK